MDKDIKYSIDRQEQYLRITLKEKSFHPALVAELEKDLSKYSLENSRNLIMDISTIKNIELTAQTFFIKKDDFCKKLKGILILVGVDNFNNIQVLPTVSEAIDMVFLHEIEKELLSDNTLPQ